MDNPILNDTTLPLFEWIKPEHVEPAFEQLIEATQLKIDQLLQQPKDWDHFLDPIQQLLDRLNRAWSPVSHLNGVLDSDALREAFGNTQTRLTEFYSRLGQNQALFDAYSEIQAGPHFERFTSAQKKLVEDAIRDFRLSGVALEEKDREAFKKRQTRISRLQNRFGQNLLDATGGWFLDLHDDSRLGGLPTTAKQLLATLASEAGVSGYRVQLQAPSYLPVMTYADDRELRKEVYTAFSTRASDQGPNAGKWDSTDIMNELLTLRFEKSTALGFGDFAELSLATKMAKDPDTVIGFLQDLLDKSKPVAKVEFEALKLFARNELGIADVAAWDVAYIAEKQKQQLFDFSDEDLRPYFSVPAVQKGLFEIAGRLFGVSIEQHETMHKWHDSVEYYEITDASGQPIASFYIDLYARKAKRGGAWMDVCRSRRTVNGESHLPVAYLTCNFTPPLNGKPALLTHDEVITLFHEFGHGLHHMLTQVDIPGLSGIAGVEWDAVELPSQFLENWCWQREALDLFAKHVDDGSAIPRPLLEKVFKARHFQSALGLVRQLEFSMFDFHMHREYRPTDGISIHQRLTAIREQAAVAPYPDSNRFAHGFAHIFEGEYAAGYFGYLWARLLSADAFSSFIEEGVFAESTGQRFKQEILEKGGSRPAMESFVAFRGREPIIEPLLKELGIAA